MELVGISFNGSGHGQMVPGPLERGYLPIADFTGILGANDSGKSSLLELLSDALEGRTDFDVVAFAECSTSEFNAITGHVTNDLIPFEGEANSFKVTPFTKGKRSSWWPDPYVLHSDELEATPLDPDGDPVEMWKERLQSTFDGDHGLWKDVLSLATDGYVSGTGETRHLLAFEPGARLEGSSQVWNVFWCCRPAEDLSEVSRHLVERLRENGPLHMVNRDGQVLDEDDPELSRCRRIWAPKYTGTILGLSVGRRVLGNGARAMPGAPIVVAPAGRTSLSLLPRPVFLRDGAAVEDELERVVESAIGELRFTRLLAHFPLDNWGDAWAALDHFVDDSYLEQVPDIEFQASALSTDELIGDPWIVGNPGRGWRLNEELGPVLERIERDVARRMPPAFSERYVLRLRSRPPASWPEEKIDIQIAPRDELMLGSDEYGDDVTQMSFHDLAEGLKLWVQIALFQALVPIEEAARILRLNSSLLFGDVIAWMDECLQHEPTDLPEGVPELQEVALANAAEFDSKDREIDNSSKEDLVALVQERTHLPDQGEVDLARGRLLLIDEPERFLHPRLQRQMADWLGRSALPSSQVVAATHSVAFMNMTREPRYVYLVRESSSPTLIVPITPREIGAMDLAAEELGLDRGELLAMVNLVLWVEGTMDRVILETLFASEIRRSGIVIVEMQGHSRAKAILETSLMRFTSARTAVWLDQIDADYASRMVREPAFAEEQLRGGVDPNSEKATLARIALASQDPLGSERRIHPIGVEKPGDDVFDLLDEQSIQTVYPEYPGHVRAHEIWEQAMADGKKRGERKNFWKSEFRTPISPESCRLIASEMRESGRFTEELLSVIGQCQMLASSSR